MTTRRGERKSLASQFGARLVKARTRAKLTQSGLARRIGVSQSMISQIEDGLRLPSYGTLVQLADGVNVTIAYLVGEDGEMADRIAHQPSGRMLSRDDYTTRRSSR